MLYKITYPKCHSQFIILAYSLSPPVSLILALIEMDKTAGKMKPDSCFRTFLLKTNTL